MATPIGSPRVPSTVGSSLVTPIARDDVVEPDDSPPQPAVPRTLRSLALLTLRRLLRLLRTTKVLRCMCRFCHAPLLQRSARLTPACLVPMLVLCPRCLLFLRLLLLLRTLFLLFRPTFLPALCPFVGTQSAPGPSSGPGQTTVVLRLRTRRLSGPRTRPPMVQCRAEAGKCPFSRFQAPPGAALNAPGHGGDLSGFPAIAQGPGATLNAPGPGGDAPAHDDGAGLALAYAHSSAVGDALGPEASARIAADIMAIAQGVATTQADLEILKNGVSDITECLEGKIRETWDFVEAELKSERDLQQHRADVAHERRVSDHETLDAHLAVSQNLLVCNRAGAPLARQSM